MTKAYGFTANGGAETETFFDQAPLTPGPSEVLVRVRAAGVNPVDWKIRAGHPTHPSTNFPQVLGREVAGVVEAVGQDVEGLAVGDEVFGNTAPGFGGYTEQTVLDASVTARRPPQLDAVWAATIPVAGATAYDAVVHLDLLPGQTLLINGIGGGVGLMAAQIGRDRGLNVIGTASADKREIVQAVGATLVDYHTGPVAAIRAILPGGVDGILDLVGGDSLREVAILITNPAKIVSAGDAATATALGGAAVERQRNRTVLEAVAALMVEGKLDPRVTDTYPLDEAPQALRAVEGGHARGKLVIDVEQTTVG